MMDFLSMTFAFLPWVLLKYWSLSPFTFDLDFLPQHKHLSFILTDAWRRAVKCYQIWVGLFISFLCKVVWLNVINVVPLLCSMGSK